MELQQLRYLVAIAETGSFTAAAAREHVAQPAVSAQLAALERQVGQRLFRRTSRGAEPTAAGLELVQHARAVLGRLDEAREAMAELAGVVRGQVAVGTVRGAPLGRLAGVLGRFSRAHPSVGITLREGESDALTAELGAGSLDLAVVGLAGESPDGLATRNVLTAPVGAVVAPDHAYAARKIITLADLEAQPIVTLPPGTGVRGAFDAACRDRGLRPNVVFEVGTVAAAFELAREGLGVAVVPSAPDDRVRNELAPDLHALRLRPVVRSRLVLAWEQDTPRTGRPAARALLETALADDRRGRKALAGKGSGAV